MEQENSTAPADVVGFERGDVAPLHLVEIAKSKEGLLPTTGNKSAVAGRQPHPIDFEAASNTKFAVATQATCIFSKRDAVVGLGFESKEQRMNRRKAKMPMALPEDGGTAVAEAVAAAEDETSKVDELCDPLTVDGFQNLLNTCGEDFQDTGNCYFEVIREGNTQDGRIVQLWHYPTSDVHVATAEKDNEYRFHYEVDGASGTLHFARFGCLEEDRVDNDNIQSELVHFRLPSARNPFYGLPQWLGSVTWLEIAQHLMSTEHDYFNNRAVPDLLVAFKGVKMSPEQKKNYTDMIRNTVGPGSRYRSLAFFLDGPNAEIDIERLAMEEREKLVDSWPVVEQAIVSAHRVPPLLAGIQIPGKMGATNELPNALVAFQSLCVSQQQRIFERVLRRTLASPEYGIEGLTEDDINLRRITDFYDLGSLDTLSRMRTPAAQAQSEGRSPSQGLKD